MEINSLDQLVRAEQSGSSSTRRSSDTTENRFANLLDAHAARARVERPAQRPVETSRRNDERPAKPVRAERPESSERAERAERPANEGRAERPHKAERNAKAESAQNETVKVDDAKTGAGQDKPAEHAEAAAPAEAAEATQPAEIVKPAADADTADTVAADALPAAPVAVDPLAQIVVAKLDVPAPVAVVIAPVVETQDANETAAVDVEADANKKSASAGIAASLAATPDPTTSETADRAKLAAEAKAAKVAAASQIALPTATLAETAKQAEPKTEDYAEFMLRNATAAASVPTADAGKDAVKADADAKDAKEGKLIVTVAQPAAIAAPVAPVTAFAVQAVVSNDNVALDAALPAKATLDGDEIKVAAKTAEPTNLFAQNLDAARATQNAEAPKAASRMPLVPPHEQVAVHIRKAVTEGLDQISIRLNPAELGRIDIKIDMRADGTLRAAFAADRQQTLELLKNDSRQLENALSDAGLRADAGGLNFSLRGDNRENAQAFRDMGSQYASRRGAEEVAESAAPVVAAGYVRQRVGNGRVDLNA